MADTASAPVAKSPAKKRVSKPKTPAAHPVYNDMIVQAITSLKERGGSSRQAILKYIMANFKVGTNATLVNSHLKTALKKGAKNGLLKQSKGTGATGSFRVGEKKAAAKKPKTKKSPKKPKKPAAKKPAKKAAAKKSPAKKKPAAKKPAAKKAAGAKKPAAKKPAAKKTAKKPAAKKPAKKPAAKKAAKK